MPPKRSIELRYKPEQIGEKTVERVCRYYTNGMELSDIVRMINGPRPSNLTLNIADVYAILNIAGQKKLIKQRKKHLAFELQINDFVTIYRAWKQGEKPKTLIALFPNCKIAIERLFRAIHSRHRNEKAELNIKTDSAAREILTFAQPRMINGVRGWWIECSDISQDLLDTTGLRADDDLEEDILIDHRKTPEDLLPKTEECVSTGNLDPQEQQPQTEATSFTQEPEDTVYQPEEEILAADVYKTIESEQAEEAIEEVTDGKTASSKLNDFL